MIKLCEVFRVTSKWRKMSTFPIINFLRKSVFVPVNFTGKHVMKLSWKYFLSSISIALFIGGFVFGLIKVAAAYGSGSYDHIFKQQCVPGYTGYRCYETCPYPSFGNQCKGKCECKPDLCHFQTGCPTPGTECLIGYIGRYCDTQCRFPYYGVDCQQTCACSPSKCSFTSNCSNFKHKFINRIFPKKTSTIIITTQKSDVVNEKLTTTEFRTQTSHTDVVNENLTATGFRTQTSYAGQYCDLATREVQYSPSRRRSEYCTFRVAKPSY